MARYIDVDELLKGIVDEYGNGSTEIMVIGVVKDLPTADVVEVKHGQWNENGIAYECNLCGASLVVEQGTADMNYCPNCGAKMDGGIKQDESGTM